MDSQLAPPSEPKPPARRLRLYENVSSLKADGSRNFVHPADVSGRYDRRRKLVFALMILVLVLLPWIKVGGFPAVFLDILHRQFFLFGATFNAQDTWLIFFLLTGVGFSLIVMTAVWGRVWCGYACPQTVFLEGLYRPIERLIEGSRNQRIARNAEPLSFDKAWRKTLKHVVFLALSFAVAHIFVAYFVSIPSLYEMALRNPAEHPAAFAWAAVLTGLFYFNFFWFREQLCLIVCPYGRLQSVLTDRNSMVIGYDSKRGEPRGKAKTPGAGDCVDCNRCVVVCPTGIDIRNGLQIDCVACARCIDACDEVMEKLDRPKGLVRYDSQNGLEGRKGSMWRPRVILYAALGMLGVVAYAVALFSSKPFEANLLRMRGLPPFSVDGERVRNAFEIHLVNKRAKSTAFQIRGAGDPRLSYVVAMPDLDLAALSDQRVPVFVDFKRGSVVDGEIAHLEIVSDGHVVSTLNAPLIAPR